ncbi:MAG: zinc metalloprotease HtpX [Phycisphaerae bacterium]|nr:zinc metalloprotease HtpX [Phycisphaerae bacterium]
MRFLSNVKTAVLLSMMIGLCMVVGIALGGKTGLVIGFMFGGVSAIISYWFSATIAIKAMGGREMPREENPRFHAMIERLAERANLPMPKVYICPGRAPNAFATGRGPSNSAVAITEGMLRAFPEPEVEGVMAHELAHIKNRDMLTSTIAAVLASVISGAGYMLYFPGGLGGGRHSDEEPNPLGGIAALLVIILAPIAATIIQLAISRQREFAADSLGGEICGDPQKLANALRRLGHMNDRIPTETNPAFHSMYIVQPLSPGGLATLFSTHPDLNQRIARLEAQAASIR